MRKILFLLSTVATVSFASSLDMSTLSCRNIKLNSSTTLSEVQSNCLIKKQTTSKGRYEVDFVNGASGKTVKCYFASNDAKALLNSCK